VLEACAAVIGACVADGWGKEPTLHRVADLWDTGNRVVGASLSASALSAWLIVLRGLSLGSCQLAQA
jgi:hypothetical protein